MRPLAILLLAVLWIGAAAVETRAGEVFSGHAMAMHGEPKYPPDFRHFDYVNPDAPKGGTLRLGVTGTFDSFNPFVIKGNAFSNIGVETLTTGSADEPFTRYGLIAESMEWPEDRSWVMFTLRPEARWHDGTPITVEDVIFSLETLKTKGQPFFRFYYGTIDRAEKVGERTVKFVFNEAGNRELPLIAGEMPILSKQYWEGQDFERSSLEPPLTSGPYKVADFEPGRYVVVERVDDYWGKDLPVNVGQDNFDQIRYEYFRDDTVLRQALKAGVIDYRNENQAKAWALDYDVPAVRDGWLKKEAIEHHRPTGMQAFVYNIRRPVFSDPKVREALAHAFDFEWSNRTLFFDQYARTESYFSNSDLAARGLPDGEELKILEKFRGRIPDAVFTEEYRAPSTDGSGWPRANLEKAFELLAEAGWEVRDMKLVNVENGEPMRFEILLVNQAFERVVLPIVRNLKRLGIEASVRLVDESQYINRARSYDFDMIVGGWGQSESPGNEQRSYWSSAAAKSPGSRNYIGIENPIVDKLVELIISAPDRESLVARTRALDRVLLWGFYVIPNWHLRVDRVLYWDKFSRPEVTPERGTSTSLWWFDPVKAERLEERRITQDIDAPGAADTPGIGAIVAWVAGLSIVGYVVFRCVLRPRRS